MMSPCITPVNNKRETHRSMSSSLHTLTRSSLTWSSPASCASISLHLTRYAGAMWSMASQRHAQASNEGGTHMKLWSAEGRRRCASEWLAPERIFVLYCIGLQRHARYIHRNYNGYIRRNTKGTSPVIKGRKAGKEIDSHAYRKGICIASGETLDPSLALCYKGPTEGYIPWVIQGMSPQDTELYKVYPQEYPVMQPQPTTWLGVTSEL